MARGTPPSRRFLDSIRAYLPSVEAVATFRRYGLLDDLDDALRHMAERIESYEVDIAVNAVLVQRQVGRMRTRLQVASWALDGALTAVGDDPSPSYDTFLAVMAAKAEVARAGIEVCDLAMEVAGGSAFFKGSVIERCYRDIRAIKFHPLTPEDTLVAAGRHAVGA